jgi:plasmid stability protein
MDGDTGKNIAVSVPDEVYRQARMKAAARDRSVTALVREFLASLDANAESDFDRRRRLQEDVLASIRKFRGGTRLDRNTVHERRAVR